MATTLPSLRRDNPRVNFGHVGAYELGFEARWHTVVGPREGRKSVKTRHTCARLVRWLLSDPVGDIPPPVLSEIVSANRHGDTIGPIYDLESLHMPYTVSLGTYILRLTRGCPDRQCVLCTV